MNRNKLVLEHRHLAKKVIGQVCYKYPMFPDLVQQTLDHTPIFLLQSVDNYLRNKPDAPATVCIAHGCRLRARAYLDRGLKSRARGSGATFVEMMEWHHPVTRETPELTIDIQRAFTTLSPEQRQLIFDRLIHFDAIKDQANHFNVHPITLRKRWRVIEEALREVAHD